MYTIVYGVGNSRPGLLKNLLTDFGKFFKEPWQQYIAVFHYIMVNEQQYQVVVKNMVSMNHLKA
jgi:hypothetical protein